MLVSIIITNYNYSLYISECIESCLNQSYNDIEVIVVDDGSTDNSREIIEKYSDSITTIFQENKGMVESSNIGFSKSRGNVIIFLDADDYLMKDAILNINNGWKEGISKIHYRLQNIDAKGNYKDFTPERRFKLGNSEVWKEIISYGDYVTTPTSGNAYSREVLEKIFPLKDAKINNKGSYYDFIPTDAYLKLRVPFFGNVISIESPQGVYRIHGKNHGRTKTPYNDSSKRYRSLKLAKLNSIFIENYLSQRNLKWNSDILFRRNKMLIIRILSLRFDGPNHVWSRDTNFSLVLKVFSNLFSPSPDRFIRKIYNFSINILLLVLPKKNSFSLLKTIHPKSFKGT